MKKMTFKQKALKVTAVYLALSLLAEIAAPTMAFALTGGPSQPEVESFEPIGTTQMVDPFSGDFNYNIPLMTVPGPNGGYPINLAYHAGIGMEQEASWVGLGWNVNVGEINRSMRGLPDEFAGEKIKKTVYHKPSWTLGGTVFGSTMTVNTDQEIIGADLGYLSNFRFYYNNYKGVGFSWSQSANTKTKMVGNYGGYLKGRLDLTFDSQSGIGLSPSIAFASKVFKNAGIFNVGFGYNSRQGWQGLTLKAEKGNLVVDQIQGDFTSGEPLQEHYAAIEDANKNGNGAGMSFSSSSFIPGIPTSMYGSNSDFKTRFGRMPSTGTPTTFEYKNLHVFTSKQYILNSHQEIPAYGYNNLNIREQYGADNAIMDFNRENEFAITKSAPSLPLPILTNDIYVVKGQGIASVFRPYRSDFGVLYDGLQKSYNIGSQLGLEQGTKTTGGHLGFNAALSYSESYSGKWQSNWSDLQSYVYNAMDETFYFKASGEMFAADDNSNEMDRYGNEEPVQFRIEQQINGGKVFNKRVDENLAAVGTQNRTNREPRVQHVEYRTRREMDANNQFHSGKHLYGENDFPDYATRFAVTSTNGAAIDYTTGAGREDGHFGQIAMRNPDGNLYVYGLPAYNNKQREVVFAINDNDPPATPDDHTTIKSIGYTSTNASTNNTDGNDNYFSATETPAYTHSHLLTAIYSPDYVDLTGNGPSDDDFGYYVKFNYTRFYEEDAGTGEIEAYRWRNPYTGANLIRGKYSDQTDNKASYVYGEKEIYYLNSIETKTHIAEFHLSDRADGYGVDDEEQLVDHNLWSARGTGYLDDTKPLKKLEKIILYSKADRTQPIKTVHFEYDYSLCGNVINNIGTAVNIPDPNDPDETIDQNEKHGKLTLKKVWFEYLNNTKGKLSPYVFDYNEEVDAENPKYNISQMDRWGNYKPDNFVDVISFKSSNEDNPYVTQRPQSNRGDNDEEAGVWSLKEIQLPSGGIMKIDYEADDYAYVQDRKAMQMMKVTGTGHNLSGTDVKYEDNDLGCLDKRNGEEVNYIFFELEKSSGTTQDELEQYFDGIELMYFKVMINLKDKIGTSGLPANDYVDGYAQIDRSDPDEFCGLFSTGEAWVKVDFVPVRQSDLTGGKVHPFRKAAFEYLKMERSDLLYASQPNALNNGTVIISTLQTILQDVGSLLTGFYANCVLRGYAKEMLLDDDHNEYRPSFIRLNTPDGFKIGGGHRVKRIRISDEWDVLSHEDTDNDNVIDGGEYSEDKFEYGQEFKYTTKNAAGIEISSGVAEYEPLIGGNENPFRMPSDRYTNRNRLFHSNLKELYIEEPIGESYYPSASVGYSRVTVRNLEHDDPGSSTVGNEINDLTATGSVVQEFYTAKDFPVVIKPTEVEHKGFQPPVLYIPFVGNQEIDYHTYSQGYKIELNDMHGKPKLMATYSNDVDINLNPERYSTRVMYSYNTIEPYDSNRPAGSPNRLNNLVTVLDADADYRMALLGQTSEFCIDMMEHSDYGATVGLALNTDYLTASPTLFASLWPSVEVSKESMQTVVTNKVINKNGILMRVVSEKDGVKAVSENLMFDSKTGTPLLTATYNNFDAPVYSYSFAGHWAYEGLEPAYKNYRKKVTFSTAIIPSSGTCGTIVNPENSFLVGDMVEVNNAYYWVDQVTPGGAGSIHLIDEDGADISSFSLDQITVMKTFRTNQQAIPNGTIVSLKNPVTERRFPLFTALNAVLENELVVSPLTVTKCNGEETSVTVTLGTPTGSTTQIAFADASIPCESSFTLPFVANSLSDLYDYEFFFIGASKVKIVHRDTEAVLYADWSLTDNCFAACMDDVLHADATRFDDTWAYDYDDAGVSSGNQALLNGYNEWRAGRAGVWRAHSTHAYRVPRKQTSPHTDIAKDGTYEHFTIYNWKSTIPQNTLWTKANEMTRYNPYGFELENKDAINIYSSALYGYGNTSVTAVAGNASYYEIASNSFEPIAGDGHLPLFEGGGSPAATSTAQAHTGEQSVYIASGYFKTATIPTVTNINATAVSDFSMEAGKHYAVSAWVYSAPGNAPVITATNVTTTLAITGNLHAATQQVEGWYRVDFDFVAPAATNNVRIEFAVAGGGAFYLDDVRIVPFKGSMKTYVYDPSTLWLLAELDNRNYATFYNYDEEGAVVQVKKETEKGVMTIQTSRNNTQRK